MRKIVATSLLIIFQLSCFAQINKNIGNYPKPDCSLEDKFFDNSEKIVLYPDNLKDKKISERSENVYYESELAPKDYNKHIEIHFPISDYDNWSKLNVPIKKTDKGFKFKNRIFNGEDDAFMFLSPNRYIISGNSQNIIDKVSFYTKPAYSVSIIENGDFKLFAGKDFVIDLAEIKKENYYTKSNKRFSAKIAHTFSNNEIDSIFFQLNSFLKDFSKASHVNLPSDPIKFYVHSNPNVARLFSNHDWDNCKEFEKDFAFGTVKFDIIHTVGLDFKFIAHEAIHNVWNGKYNVQNFLLNEGVAVYYSLIKDYMKKYTEVHSKQENQFYTMLQSKMDYNFSELIVNKEKFWEKPKVSYAFAGLFTEFLINNYGLEKFKTIYKNYKNPKSFKTVYKITLDTLINDFKSHVKRHNAP
jgi:hypothetical protein